MTKSRTRTKIVLSFLVLALLLTSFSVVNVSASRDDPVSGITNGTKKYVLFLPPYESSSTGAAGDYCLNPLTSGNPYAGVNLTQAKYTSGNVTQQYLRVKLTTPDGDKWGWGCATNANLLMFCRRREANAYVNVQHWNTATVNGTRAGYGEFDVHAQPCFGVGGSHGEEKFVSVISGGTRYVLCQTNEQATSGQNYYLKWHTGSYGDTNSVRFIVYTVSGSNLIKYGGQNCPHTIY